MPGLLLLLLVGCATVQQQPQTPASQPTSQPVRPTPAPAAGWTPVELGLAYGAQLAGADHDVYGLRLDLISGENHAVYGLDLNLGFGEQTTGGGGIAVGLVRHVTGGDFGGVQLALGRNEALDTTGPDAALYGLQLAVLANQAHEMNGLQAGLVNYAETLHGVQVGLIEGSDHLRGAALAGILSYVDDGYGVQIAPATYCQRTLHGIQIGLFNVTGGGLQIGLLNINENGFLPVFPIVNF